MSRTSPVDLRKHLDEGGAYDLDALRLLRVVHLRRALRASAAICFLALAVWAAYSLSMEAYYDEGSTNWRRIDDETGPGFLIILVVLAAAVVALGVSGRVGRHGRVAARLVPAAGRAAQPALRPSTSAPALRARLRRQGFVRAFAVWLVLLFGLLTVMTGTAARPAWQANHGRGGTVVTIDKDDVITSQANGPRPRTWFLGTGEGTAVAESGRPEVGERWTITRDVFDNVTAYRVGGHDYLLVGGLFVLSALIVLGAGSAQVQAVRTERRLRRAEDGHDLAADVVRLAAGARPKLLLNGDPVGVLGLPDHAGRNAARTRRTRRIVAASSLTIVVAGLATLLVVGQLSLLSGPPDDREVQLPYLITTRWESPIRIDYDDGYYGDDLRDWAGPDRDRISRARKLTLYAEGDSDQAVPRSDADVVVARIGTADAARLRAGWQADNVTAGLTQPVAGLPAGWSGVFGADTSISSGGLDALWLSHGVAVRITMDVSFSAYSNGKYRDGRYSRQQLSGYAASLAATLTRTGAHRLDRDTARPAHA